MSNQNEIEDFLAHYGVLGMKWGKRKLTPRQARTSKEKRVGSTVGTVVGAVGSQAAISAGSRLLRSKTVRRVMVKATLKKLDLPLGRNMWSKAIFDRVVNDTEMTATLLSSAKFRAGAAVGSAFVGNVIGGLSAVRIKESSILKEERLTRERS